jgi:hypothetical protein
MTKPLTGSRTTPICPGLRGGLSSQPRTPRTFGGCPSPAELLVAVMGVVDWPRAVVVASPDAVLVAVAEEADVSPPDPFPAAGVVARVEELCSAPLPPPFSGVSAPVPRPGNRRRAGASGTCSLRLGCAAQVPPPEPRRSFGPGQHPHYLSAGALAPALSPFLSRWGPNLWVPAPQHLRWGDAGGSERRQGSGARGWGRPPVVGPPGRPRPGSASTTGPMTAMPGPRTGP